MSSTFKKNLYSALILIEALVFLLPMSWMCAWGLSFFFMGLLPKIFSGGEWLDQRFWGEGTVILGGAYGLAALWWLVFTHRSISFAEVPRLIWGGIVAGCAIAFYWLYEWLYGLRVADKESIFELFLPSIGFYIDLAWHAGPLLLLLTLLLAIPVRISQEPPDLPQQRKHRRPMPLH